MNERAVSERPVPDLSRRAVLVVRPDGLGDVILSLPVFGELRERFAGARLTLLASPAAAPLAANHPWIDSVIVDADRGLRGFWALVDEVKKGRFAAAIILRPTLRHAAVVAAARIPCRVGTAFRAYSWLFTHRVHQHRRGSGRHEVELNLGLLDPFGGPGRVRRPWVPVDPEAQRQARALVGGEKPFVVLHPGSAGSADDWPPEHFAAVGRALVLTHGVEVVVTGVASESRLVGQVTKAVPGARDLAGRTTLPVLAALLAEARAVVAGSTGTLHLAAAVGTPVVGIYPAIGDISPVRWGPCGPDAVILEAEIAASRHSEGARARGRSDMASVSPEAVLAALAPWITKPPRDSEFVHSAQPG